MQIKRDYSQPFFGVKRRSRSSGRLLFFAGLLAGAVLLFVFTRRSELEMTMLQLAGMAPTPTPGAQSLADGALGLFAIGDVVGAADLMGRAVQQRPNDVTLNYLYGSLLIEANNNDMALLVGDRLIELAPEDVRGYALSAQALANTGDGTQSVAIGQTGLSIDAQFAPLHTALSLAYINGGRYQEGFDAAVRAVELDPADYNARRAFAYALAIAGRREEAIEQLEIAIGLNPNLTAAYFEVAGQYLALGQDERAIAMYEQILTLQPRNARAHLRLCESYAKTGRFDEAIGYCQDAVAIEPGYTPAYLQLGRLHYRARQFPEALSAFRSCVDSGSESIECFYFMGLSYYYVGDCDQAWTVLQDASQRVQSVPDNEEYIEDIRAGLNEISTYCLAYIGRSAAATPIPTGLPTPLPTAAP